MAEHQIPGESPEIEGKNPNALSEEPEPFIVRQMMAMMSSGLGSQDQLLDKLSRAQLDKVIDQGEAAEKRAHERFMVANQTNTLIAIVVIVGIIVLILGLAWIFLSHGNAAELREIIALLLGAGIGGAGGFGLGLNRGKKQAES